MYSEDDLVIQQYMQDQHHNGNPNVSRPDQILSRMAYGDGQVQTQAAVADAMARAIVAQEQSKTALALAECAVRMKELDVMGRMETTKITENASVERCKIQQEHQSQRFARLANVWDLSIKEQASTLKETTAVKEETKRQALSAQERVDVARIKAEASAFNSVSIALTVMFGAFGARTLLAWMIPFRRGKRRGGVPWLSLLFLFGGGFWASRLSPERWRPRRILVSILRFLAKFILPEGIYSISSLAQHSKDTEKNSASPQKAICATIGITNNTSID